MAQQEFSIPALMKRLRSESDAYEFLEELRWGGQPVCPHCGSVERHHFLKPANGTARATRTGSMSERRVWKCKDCRKQFSVLTGTVFHGTKIPIRTWCLVTIEMCASKNSVSAKEIQRKYDLTNKSAWFMLHRIREAMKDDGDSEPFSGTVVADKTFIGGNPGNARGRSRTGGVPAWMRRDNKTPVLALVHRETGQVRSRVIPDVTAPTLRKAIAHHVNMAETDLQTDSWTAYKSIAPEFRSHRAVNHHAWEYVAKDGATTNHAEGYFSQLKRSIDGTHHHVSRVHLARYLAQFDFLYTHCKRTDSERMRILLDRVAGRRLTYRPLRSV